MKVLVVEDDENKAAEIKDLVRQCCGDGRVVVTAVSNVNAALHALGGQHFDLIVADLVLPQMQGSAEPQDATPQWCEHIENYAGARLSSWVIMTGYTEIASEARQSFARHGVAVIEYDNTGGWKKVLTNRISERFVNPPMDFILLCALEKERTALQHCRSVELGEMFTAGGLDCLNVSCDQLRGIAIVLPRAGLVSAAIGAVKAAEIFRPKAIAMCGICGGVEGETSLGDLIVPDVSWNYQAGKITGGKLRPQLVQTFIPPLSQAALQQMTSDEMSASLRKGLFQSELAHRKILMSPMVSGSQVVADKQVVVEIGMQSRKVGALDMEVASVFAAAHDYFNGGGVYFAAKTVVDLADEDKDDRYHEYGCVLSARFVMEALKVLCLN
jgi:nucleoside phosphorylase